MEAPTLERLRHSYGYDAPERSQTANRVAYVLKTPFQAMEDRGAIDDDQGKAAKKLWRHYVGAMGIRIGDGDGMRDDECEFPEIYHGQMIRMAWRQVTSAERHALEILLKEAGNLEQIGRWWKGYKDKGRSIAAGESLVTTGLERLAVHWRFKTHDP